MSVTSKEVFWALLQNDALCHVKAITEIQEEFDIARGDTLISGENLGYLMQELAAERIASRVALVALNRLPVSDPEEARMQIYDLCEEAFQKLLKVSGRTKQNNKTREITLPDYFVCAAYVAHVRLLERDGKNPGWRKLEKRVTDILGRSPHRRDEWKHLVTKSRFDKLLPIFRKLTQEPGYATPERVVEATQFDWLTQ
jgi:hypothetical protein